MCVCVCVFTVWSVKSVMCEGVMCEVVRCVCVCVFTVWSVKSVMCEECEECEVIMSLVLVNLMCAVRNVM